MRDVGSACSRRDDLRRPIVVESGCPTIAEAGPLVMRSLLGYSRVGCNRGGGGGVVRVIAGEAKGRRLRPVPGTGTRPITDRAKSALFSILGDDVRDSRFLDLFAGTGQVGIEALSRGASEAVFVERARLAVRTIRENLAHTRLVEQAEVLQADVFHYLARTPEPFDIVFIAPPQYQGLWSRALIALDGKIGWLASVAQVVVQIHPREYSALDLDRLALFDQRSYGGVMLCFYEEIPLVPDGS